MALFRYSYMQVVLGLWVSSTEEYEVWGVSAIKNLTCVIVYILQIGMDVWPSWGAERCVESFFYPHVDLLWIRFRVRYPGIHTIVVIVLCINLRKGYGTKDMALVVQIGKWYCHPSQKV